MTHTRKRSRLLVPVVVIAGLVAACGTSQADNSDRSGTPTRADSELLPLGDGRLSDRPESGSVFSCQTEFPSRNGPAARADKPWIIGDQYDPAAKPTVDGEEVWPDSAIDITVHDGERVITANNLPEHPTGIFPITPDDDAYEYDTNPNPIREQDILLRIPVTPSKAAEPSCVPMGMIGFTLSGAAIYNALDIQGRDGGAHEIQDSCSGHPQGVGQYHYHTWSECIEGSTDNAGGHSGLVGYAIDGYGIYGPTGSDGNQLTNADLDACHGHTGPVEWDGRTVTMYHYHFTAEYPYTIACFTGTPTDLPQRPAAHQHGGHRHGAHRHAAGEGR